MIEEAIRVQENLKSSHIIRLDCGSHNFAYEMLKHCLHIE